MGTLGRIPNGQLVPGDGEPSAFQAFEERILIETPSHMMVPAMTIL